MVGTIVPVVYGEFDRHGRRRYIPLFLHVLGGALGGAFVGFVLALLHGLDPLSRLASSKVLAGVVALLYTLEVFGLWAVPRPHLHRQVSRKWQVLPIEVYALVFGLLLGLGVTTFIYTACLYVVLLVGIGEGGTTAVALMTIFGVARALPILGLGIRRSRFKDIGDMAATIDQGSVTARLVGALLLMSTAAFFLTSAARSPGP